MEDEDRGNQTENQNEKISEIAGSAQTAWFSLLIFLGFYILVILTTTDADFLSKTKQTQLPLINISIASDMFYLAAPVVALVLYAYLHFLCMTLWRQAQRTDAPMLEASLSASLIGTIALALKPGARPRGLENSQTLIGGIGAVGAGLLIWVAQPLVLYWSFFTGDAAAPTIPALGAGVWTVIGAWLVPGNLTIVCFGLSVVVGVVSLVQALGIRKPADHKEMLGVRDLLGHLAHSVTLLVVCAAAVACAALGLWRMADHRPSITVDRVLLVATPAGWAPPEARREAYRRDWCKEADLRLEICAVRPVNTGSRIALAKLRDLYCAENPRPDGASCRAWLASLDRAFAADFSRVRKGEIEAIPVLDLKDRKLVGMKAVHAQLVHARLEGARLGNAPDAEEAGSEKEYAADLSEANLEGATLIDAKLFRLMARSTSFDHADLTGAFLTGAALRSASLESAALKGATLDGATLKNAGMEYADLSRAEGGGRASLRSAELTDARLTGANLAGADLTGAILDGADLTGADLTDADLTGAILDGADLTGVIGLDRESLARAVGNGKTILPRAEPPLHVARCWTEAPEGLPEPKWPARRRECGRAGWRALAGERPEAPPPPVTPVQAPDLMASLDAGNATLQRLASAVEGLRELPPLAVSVSLDRGPDGPGPGEVPATGASLPPPPQTGPLAWIHFDVGSDALTDEARARARMVASRIAPDSLVSVVGYADRTGGQARNRALATARAQAVAGELVLSGVSQDRIAVTGEDEARGPVATGDGVSEPLNRSVAVSLVPAADITPVVADTTPVGLPDGGDPTRMKYDMLK